MKKNTFLTVTFLLFTIGNIFSQNTYPWPSNGNIGIGTNSPEEKLDVTGNISADRGIFDKSLPDGTNFANANERNERCAVLNLGRRFTAGESLLTFYDFPKSNMNSSATTFLDIEDRNFNSRYRFIAESDSKSDFVCYTKSQTPFFQLSENGSNTATLMLPFENSYVTIGTNTYSESGINYKLSVNGKVRAESVKVYTDWADYVFMTDYELTPINEVELYIKKNGHLKNIPTASEVKSHGIDLGEMNKLLLEKVEELTLYMIDQQKQIDNLKKDIETN